MDASTSNIVKTECLLYRSRSKAIMWSSEAPCGRNEARIMFKGLASVKGDAERVTTPEESFLLFFSPDVMNRIVTLTNVKIKKVADTKTKKDMDYSLTDDFEIRAFLAILIVSGIYLYERVAELWESNGFGIDIVKTTMSKNRFNFLIQNFQCTAEDSIDDISEFMDVFNKNCQKNFELSSYATLEEQCVPSRGEAAPVTFRGFASKDLKDRKAGIRMITVRDSRVNYTHACVLEHPDKELKDLVAKVTAKLRSSKRLIIADKRFTCSEIVEHFSDDDLFFLGHLKRTAPEVPSDLVTRDEQDESITLFYNNMTLICHANKNNETEFLLSNLPGVRESLPDVLETYDALSCPKDVVDAMCRNYSCAKRTHRWVTSILFRLIDIACINAQVIFTINAPTENLSRRQFLKRLVSDLVKPHLTGRVRMSELPNPVRQLAAKIANVPFLTDGDVLPQPKLERKRRCQVCPKPNDCKSPYFCQGCQRCICRKRAFYFCRDCINVNGGPATADDDDE